MVASKFMTIPEETDFLIVGAGIAGLRAAIELAGAGRVLVVTKEQLWESNTSYAQGGIAVALGGEEDVSLHLEDTMSAGDGLVAHAAAEVLVSEGPMRVEELLAWGTGFDRENGKLMLTREGAHSRNRILHAHGDSTGAEIGRSLLAHAQALKNITLVPWAQTVELLFDGRQVLGATVLTREGLEQRVFARAVLLASGGAGQVYSDTTNPSVATGDGIALAMAAGADVADMEFYQFHPTALSLPGVQRFLLSEALRGEGAYLRNARGERFMERYHPLLELAPRDVVARAITREGFGERPGETLPVHLDMRHVRGVDLAQRFPGISGFLRQHGLELGRDLIPVRPAAHYLMGGVTTDLDGRTSRLRLYAAGEVACTGVHGANRLASNSLLEGLVFGARAAKAMREEPALDRAGWANCQRQNEPEETPGLEEAIHGLQAAMWRCAGLLRDEEHLDQLAPAAHAMHEAIPKSGPKHWTRRVHEARSLEYVSSIIQMCALRRKESRGGHFREDYPERDDAHFQKHSVFGPGGFRLEAW
jgi:L-aspartate oxidase